MPKGEEVVSLIVAESAGGNEDENEDDATVEETVIENGDAVIEVGDDDGMYILTATENGYGKRTPLPDYPRKGRGTQGVIGIQTTERNGKLVSAVLMGAADEVLLISDGGTLVRTRGSEISRVGRNTQGVTLIRLSKDEKLQAVERMDASIGDDELVDVVPVAGRLLRRRLPPPTSRPRRADRADRQYHDDAGLVPASSFLHLSGAAPCLSWRPAERTHVLHGDGGITAPEPADIRVRDGSPPVAGPRSRHAAWRPRCPPPPAPHAPILRPPPGARAMRW